MSIMQEYEQIRKEIGHDKYDAIDKYLEEICPKEIYDKYQKELNKIFDLPPDEWLKQKQELETKFGIVFLSDVLYKAEEWDKFEKWYQEKQKGKNQTYKKLVSNKDKIKSEYTKEALNGDLPYGAEVHHNGYICLVDDYNDDNITETIVEIYKSKKDMQNGKYLERVSLKNNKLEKNIKDYIKENYNPIRREREAR